MRSDMTEVPDLNYKPVVLASMQLLTHRKLVVGSHFSCRNWTEE